MELREFAQQVKDLRSWQRRWFGGDKSSAVLDACKQRERSVDKAVAEILDGQGKLFEGEDQG